MNILTQFSLISVIYLVIIVASALYNKYGKNQDVKNILKREVAPVALVCLFALNIIGFVLWLCGVL